MAAPLKAVDCNADLQALMSDLAARARAAARVLALAPPEQKNRALEAIDREWLRQKLLFLKEERVRGYAKRTVDDLDVKSVWRELGEYRRFYQAAEKAGLPVLSTISH